MTEEAKKLFNAPWYVDIHAVDGFDGETYVFDGVYNDKCELVCGNIQKHVTSNRITHLPELYDALIEGIALVRDMQDNWSSGYSLTEYINKLCKYNKELPYDYLTKYEKLLETVKEGK